MKIKEGSVVYHMIIALKKNDKKKNKISYLVKYLVKTTQGDLTQIFPTILNHGKFGLLYETTQGCNGCQIIGKIV